MDIHNQLGVAQGHSALDNNTKEGGDMIIKRDKIEDTEEVKDEDIKGTEEEGSKDEDNPEDVTGHDGDEEDEKREAMLTNIDSKYNKVNVFLKGVGLKTNAVEHELHRGARTDIIIHGDDHGMIRLFGGNAVKNTPDKNPGKSKVPHEVSIMSENVENKTYSTTRKKRRIIWLKNHACHPTVMNIDKVRWELIRIPSGNIDQSNKIMEKQTLKPRKGEKSKKEKVICVDHEDDPGEGSSQQVDHKVVVDDVNNANVNEDDLEDVLEVIKGLDGDQIMENMER